MKKIFAVFALIYLFSSFALSYANAPDYVKGNIPEEMQPGSVIIYDEDCKPIVIEGGYKEESGSANDVSHGLEETIYPYMKVLYNNETGYIEDILFKNNKEPKGYAIRSPQRDDVSGNDVIGITNHGYYIKSGTKIFFSKNLEAPEDERIQIFDVENQKYTCASTEDYFVIFKLNEKDDGKAFYFKGKDKKQLNLYPGNLQYKLPKVQSIGGNKIVLLTYEKGKDILSYTMWTSAVQVFNLDKDEYFHILSQKYGEGKDKTIGRVITLCGGYEDTIYVVRSRIPKEEKALEISKYKMDFESGEVLEIVKERR